jgi:hypothetical protein
MVYLRSLPDQAVLRDVFAAFPQTSRPLLDYHQALLRGLSPLSIAERELIAAVDTAPVDERMQPVLRYVGKLTRTPSRMTLRRRRRGLRRRVGRAGAARRRVGVRAAQLHEPAGGRAGDPGSERCFQEAAERLANQGYAGLLTPRGGAAPPA